jgi:hypothetical protein
MHTVTHLEKIYKGSLYDHLVVWLSVYVHLSMYPPNFCYEAYEIILLSGCL